MESSSKSLNMISWISSRISSENAAVACGDISAGIFAAVFAPPFTVVSTAADFVAAPPTATSFAALLTAAVSANAAVFTAADVSAAADTSAIPAAPVIRAASAPSPRFILFSSLAVITVSSITPETFLSIRRIFSFSISSSRIRRSSSLFLRSSSCSFLLCCALSLRT